MKLKKFSEYIGENKEDSMSQDASVANLIQEIDRNYNNSPSLSSIVSQNILIHEERRDWKNFIENAELNSLKDEAGKFYMRFEKEAEEIEIQLNFNLSFKGVENFDVPDPDYNYTKKDKRLGISLENLKIRRIKVKSPSISYDSSKFSKDLNKTALRFLLNIFKPQFDMIGDEALIIRQL